MASYNRSRLTVRQVRAAHAAATAALLYLPPSGRAPHNSWNRQALQACPQTPPSPCRKVAASYAAAVRQAPPPTTPAAVSALQSCIHLLEQLISHSLPALCVLKGLPTSSVPALPQSPLPFPRPEPGPPSPTTPQPALATTTPRPPPTTSHSSAGSHGSQPPTPSSHGTANAEWVDMDVLDDKLRQQDDRLEDRFSVLDDRMNLIEEVVQRVEWTAEAELVDTEMLNDAMRQHNGHMEDRLNTFTVRMNSVQQQVKDLEKVVRMTVNLIKSLQQLTSARGAYVADG